MDIRGLLGAGAKLVSAKSSLILTAVAVVGVVSTAVVTYKAAPHIKESVEDLKQDLQDIREDEELNEEEKKQEKRVVIKKWLFNIFKAIWPVLLVIVITCSAVITSHNINMRRQAALAAAYDVSMKALQEYQDKTKEVLGDSKEKELIRDAIAEDRVRKNPITSETNIFDTGCGSTLYYDTWSGRYFRSDTVLIRRVENELNKKLYSWNYVSLNEFYDAIGLPSIKFGEDNGWNVGSSVIDISFGAMNIDDQTSCLVLEYDVFLRDDYRNLR